MAETVVSEADVLQLLSYFYKSHDVSRRNDPQLQAIQECCTNLFNRDYITGRVHNHEGLLCSTYPLEILVIEGEKTKRPPSQASKPPAPDPLFAAAPETKNGSPKPQKVLGFAPSQPSASASASSSSPSPSSASISPSPAPASALNITKQAVVAVRDGSPSILGKSLLKTSSQPFPASGNSLVSSSSPTLAPSPPGAEPAHRQPGSGKLAASAIARSTERSVENNYPRLKERNGRHVNNRHPRGMNAASLDDLYLPVSASLDTGFVDCDDQEADDSSSVPESEGPTTTQVSETSITSEALQEYLENCKYSRVWSRFPVPVIYCRKKHICRSSALSTNIEVMLNAMREKTTMFIFGQPSPSSAGSGSEHNAFEDSFKDSSDKKQTSSAPSLSQSRQDVTADVGSQSINQQRMSDISLLKYLGVKSIFDLMVESKKVKYFVNVCSSEKADSEKRYQNAGFDIVVAPYPGCEFFCLFKNQKHCARKLHFDWKQNPSHVVIDIPRNAVNSVQWGDYREWDLVLLSQNYLRLLLTYVEDPESSAGLLVHCISGWDRTPLFVSLLRMSLWADGEVHQTLSAVEMLYLTIGYDWLLFSHLLNDRKRKGEDIFDFCFYFLMFIEGDEFSLKDTETLDVSLPEHSPKCRKSKTDSRSPSDSRPSSKESDAFQFRGSSWQLVSDLGSLGSSLPRRDSFNIVGDDDNFPRIPSSEQLDSTPDHSLSECNCCVDLKNGCDACAVESYPLSRQARLARRRQRLREIRRLFAKVHEHVFPKSKPTQGPGGMVLNWILGK